MFQRPQYVRRVPMVLMSVAVAFVTETLLDLNTSLDQHHDRRMGAFFPPSAFLQRLINSRVSVLTRSGMKWIAL